MVERYEGAPTCFNCTKTPDQVPGWLLEAKIEGVTVEEYARQDGTYNPATNRFCCDDCYIKIGMPSAPGGWRAP